MATQEAEGGPRERVDRAAGCRLAPTQGQEGPPGSTAQLRMEARMRPSPSPPAGPGPWSQQKTPGPGEEAALSQKLLREHWQQDAIVRPQSRYFRGNQKHQLGK